MLTNEIPKLIDHLNAFLKAGTQIPDAISLSAQKTHWSLPISKILHTISSCHLHGMSFQDSIAKAIELNKKSKSKRHLDYMLMAIQLGHISGANLISILEKAKEKTQNSIYLEQKIRVMTAQMKFQALIISCLPLILSLIIYFISPSHIHFFFQNYIGNILFITIIFLNILGFISLNYITRIE